MMPSRSRWVASSGVVKVISLLRSSSGVEALGSTERFSTGSSNDEGLFVFGEVEVVLALKSASEVLGLEMGEVTASEPRAER